MAKDFTITMDTAAFKISVEETIRQIQKDTFNHLYTTAVNLQGDARREAPSSEGELRSTISILEQPDPDNLNVTIGTRTWYAPFIEYGTRQKKTRQYDVPNYQAGKWADFVSAIERWAGRKGIQASPYVLARSIYLNGINPHPFMTPAFEKNRRPFLKGIREIIRKYTR